LTPNKRRRHGYAFVIALPHRVVIVGGGFGGLYAGVQASPLGRVLAQRAGAPLDRAGRAVVEPDCSLRGHPDIFVIGDLASFTQQTGIPLAAVAPVAMQQGRYVARQLQQRLRGRAAAPFRDVDYGTMAVIGRGAAVAQIRRLHFNGFVASPGWHGCSSTSCVWSSTTTASWCSCSGP
jgi:NADH dehydrogenase FAD-containing subunit